MTLREYAWAVTGMLQALRGMVNERTEAAAIVGPPKGPAALRVSATRQGVTGTNHEPVAGTPVVNDQIAELVEPELFLATICQ